MASIINACRASDSLGAALVSCSVIRAATGIFPQHTTKLAPWCATGFGAPLCYSAGNGLGNCIVPRYLSMGCRCFRAWPLGHYSHCIPTELPAVGRWMARVCGYNLWLSTTCCTLARIVNPITAAAARACDLVTLCVGVFHPIVFGA